LGKKVRKEKELGKGGRRNLGKEVGKMGELWKGVKEVGGERGTWERR